MDSKENDQKDNQEENVIKVYGRNQLKRQLKDVHRAWRITRIRNIVGLFIAILLVALGAFFLISNHSKKNKAEVPIARAEAIFDQYFSVYPSPAIRGENTDSVTSEFERVLVLYSEGQFREFITKVDSLNLQNSMAKFYLSNALMAEGKFEQALPIWRELITSPIFRPQSQWYLGLTLIQTSQNEEAIALFQELSKYTNPYQQDAAQLIEKLPN